jgi:hypothetical protein
MLEAAYARGGDIGKFVRTTTLECPGPFGEYPPCPPGTSAGEPIEAFSLGSCEPGWDVGEEEEFAETVRRRVNGTYPFRVHAMQIRDGDVVKTMYEVVVARSLDSMQVQLWMDEGGFIRGLYHCGNPDAPTDPDDILPSKLGPRP